MKFSWGDSIFFAFLWASVWAGALTCYVLDWKVEWMQPKLWFLYVKKKLNKSKSIFFKATKISQKVLNPFETVLSALEDGNIQNSSVNIGQSYRQKIEHEMKLLQANDITHEIRIAYAKLPEANKKNHDFKHWNDAGREWREAILQGTVSNRYRNKKVEKSCTRTFSHMVQSYLDNPGIFVMMKLKAKTEMKSNNFILNIRKSCVQAVALRFH